MTSTTAPDSEAHGPPHDAGAGTRLRLVAATGAVVLVAVVAVAGAGNGLLHLPLALEGMTLHMVRAAGVLAAVAGVLWLRAERHREGSSGRGHDPTAASLATAATIMVTLALLSFLLAGINPRETEIDPQAPPPPSASDGGNSAGQRPGGEGATGGGGFGMTGSDPSGGGRAGSPGEGAARPEAEERATLDLLRRILIVLLLLAAAMFCVWYFRRVAIRLPAVAPVQPVTATEAEAGLLASLAELDAEGGNVRQQVTAAYRALLAALADAGAPRLPHEAPYEHLHRVLGPLGVPAAPMHRLTELHVTAEFSTHDVTDRHREAAAHALATSLDSLRAASAAHLDAVQPQGKW